MKKKPNFLIVGAAKAGTTSVAKYLDQHPDIFIPQDKEIRYFISEIIKRTNPKDPILKSLLNKSVLEKEEYFNLFNVKEKVAGEASVHYLYHYKEAIPNIINNVGDIPIIIILRNPIDRAISNWQYIDKDFYTFEEAIKQEEFKIENNYNSFMYYKSLGLYYHQVKAYLDSFSNVKIILFEDLKKDSNEVVNSIFKFLNVPSIGNIDTKTIHNTRVNYVPRYYFFKLIKHYKVNQYIIKVLKFLSLENHFYIKKEKKISDRLHSELLEYYTSDIEKLEKLINKDLTKWKL
ncbi:MAG: hypothetical protein ACI9JT_000854 [Polaribacter sp.]|jgi:hypothetical protein